MYLIFCGEYNALGMLRFVQKNIYKWITIWKLAEDTFISICFCNENFVMSMKLPKYCLKKSRYLRCNRILDSSIVSIQYLQDTFFLLLYKAIDTVTCNLHGWNNSICFVNKQLRELIKFVKYPRNFNREIGYLFSTILSEHSVLFCGTIAHLIR